MIEREFAMIAVPSSAGAHGAGQERAPNALRDAGLLTRLRDAGVQISEGETLPTEVFRADPTGFPTRNLEAVVRVARGVADAVDRQARAGRIPLVVGGDCTLTIGAVAGMRRTAPDLRVAYIDGDADLTSPERTRSGILDATGVAQLLGVADTALARVGDRYPLLRPDELILLGYDPDDPDSFDPAVVAAHRDLRHLPYSAVREDVDRAVGVGLETLRGHPSLVHFDVDVVDSADLPLADFPHYGTGLPVDIAQRLLIGLLTADDLRCVVLTEVNPTKDVLGEQLLRYLDLVVAAVAGAGAAAE